MISALAFPSPEAPEDRLHSHCLFCGCRFPRSGLFSGVPPGDRLACDPERGRLWSICGRCTSWNLIPVEERFDAIEELERAVHDRALWLASTANVSLYEVDDLLLVRIGRAELVERTAWRYGRELLTRNGIYWRYRTRLSAATAGAVARLGEQFGMIRLDRHWGPSGIADVLRWQRFGSVAWNGKIACSECGSVLHTLHFDSSWWLYPRIERDRLVVGVPCMRCDPWTPQNVFDMAGELAHIVLRRALAYQHIAGADTKDLEAAAVLLRRARSPNRLINELSTGYASLWRLGPVQTIALEIAVNQLAEQRAFEVQLHGLEAVWRMEETLAAIVDDELSWP